jgi:MSHA pilin protein MshD
MCSKATNRYLGRQDGISLVELVMFIAIVAVGLAGVLSVMNTSTAHSSDPLLRKQASAIAEALMEEVSLMPFTTCDPDGFDPGTKACTQPEAFGPETEMGEARGHATTPFDNVNDYNGFSLTGGGADIGGGAGIVVPAGYTARVAVASASGFGPGGAAIADADVLQITVTVTIDSTGDAIALDGFRTRFDP